MLSWRITDSLPLLSNALTALVTRFKIISCISVAFASTFLLSFPTWTVSFIDDGMVVLISSKASIIISPRKRGDFSLVSEREKVSILFIKALALFEADFIR